MYTQRNQGPPLTSCMHRDAERGDLGSLLRRKPRDLGHDPSGSNMQDWLCSVPWFPLGHGTRVQTLVPLELPLPPLPSAQSRFFTLL